MPSTATVSASLPQSALHKRALNKLRKPEPAHLAQLVEQMESDYQFKLATLVLTSVIETAHVSIDVDGDDRAQALADNLLQTWRQTLASALRAISYGRAAFEKTYRIDSVTGLALVAGLDYLPFEYTTLKLNADGAFAGVELSAGDRRFHLVPERSWWFALDPTSTQPHGQSRYLGAPSQVLRDRRRLEDLEQIWYSKFAIGHGVARAPESEAVAPRYDSGPPGEFASEMELLDPMEVMREQCARIESGGVLVLSSQRYPDGTYLYDYQETEGLRDGTALENRRRMLDAAALRSMGVPERAVTQDAATGSYALAAVHQQVLFKTCEGILSQLVASYQKYVIRKAVEVNWSEPNRPQLRMRYEPFNNPPPATAS